MIAGLLKELAVSVGQYIRFRLSRGSQRGSASNAPVKQPPPDLIESPVPRTATLEIAGGVRIVMPDSLNLITPYVLYEQQDWFEEELGFLRRILRPGENAIDIGANYGVYALSIANV